MHAPYTTSLLDNADTVSLVLTSCLHGLYSLTHKPAKKTDTGFTGLADGAGAAFKSLNQLYILVVCVLMLVQDSAVLHEISKDGRDVALPWYQERQLTQVILLSAVN